MPIIRLFDILNGFYRKGNSTILITHNHQLVDNFVNQGTGIAKQVEFANAPLVPPRLVTGVDLMQLGWSSGPDLGRVLNEIQTLQLEGQLTTKEQAIVWAQSQRLA